jgi:hypothetical protein
VAEFDTGKLLLGQCVLNFLMVIQQDVERDRLVWFGIFSQITCGGWPATNERS